MTDIDRYPEKNDTAAGLAEGHPVLKTWATPKFTLVGDLRNAQVNNKNPKIDHKLKGNHIPPGQGS